MFSLDLLQDKTLNQQPWKTPPTHPWYNRQAPGGALIIKADRAVRSTNSWFEVDILIDCLLIRGKKIFLMSTNCNSEQSSPEHLLKCTNLDKDGNISPHPVYDLFEDYSVRGLEARS
ncbi:hypothetical protein CEXT_29321 [Caerostris extrusa]|uniref:Uncharacterized protein n=1 Tax=Caerostris extrusa TaxID=172846 RepID=A0AAV4SMT5_CAEEX|nr:hypothetical protein CEXT_29321 [Caerostris extrusa]